MTKYWKICSVLAAAVISVFLFVAAAAVRSAQPVSAEANTEICPEESVYSIRLAGNQLGAYAAESGELLFSGMVDAAQLSGSDRAMLENGVSAGTLEEVLCVFEDFCS